MEKDNKQYLQEFDSNTLLTQVEFTLTKISVDSKYPELQEVAKESVEILQLVNERTVRALGRLGIKSAEQMLFEYIEKGGKDQDYIDYLTGKSRDPRD